jgi:hypothetical protein
MAHTPKLTDLTLAQYNLLVDLYYSALPVSQGYRPAQKLHEIGFAAWEAGKYSDFLVITEAGRNALARDGGTK